MCVSVVLLARFLRDSAIIRFSRIGVGRLVCF